MDSISESSTQLALIVRSLIECLLVIGGIMALRFGYVLYLKGVGLKADGTTIETKKLKARLQTVGSVVMATAVAWAVLGYLASPKFSQGPGGTTVASVSVQPVALAEHTTDARALLERLERTRLLL